MPDEDTIESVDVTTEKPIVPRWFWVVSAVILIIAIVINVEAYFAAGTAERMGQWGDFVGGVFNPLLSFLAFAGLLYTILLQQRELGLSREELRMTREELANSAKALNDQNLSLKQQRFESAFFGMVGVFNQIIETMDIDIRRRDSKEGLSGRDCFSRFREELEAIYINRSWNDEPTHEKEADRPWITGARIEYHHDEARMVSAYQHFYKKAAPDLAHYFRVLYNIFRYIENSDFTDGVYSKILRAQLSNQELVILFYNCFSEAGQRFKDVAIRFEIFDNLDVGQLIRPEHKSLIAAQAFGEVQ